MPIFVKHTQPFTAVPNHIVNNQNISVEALGVITYLAGKPEGWIARVYDIRKRFKLGEKKWERISKELRALGVLSHIQTGEGRQLVFELKWIREDVDKPVEKPCDPTPENRTMPDPTRGNRGIYKERYTKKDLLEKKTYRSNNNCSKIEQQEPQEVFMGDVSTMSEIEKDNVRQNVKHLLQTLGR